MQYVIMLNKIIKSQRNQSKEVEDNTVVTECLFIVSFSQ
jgi:hypothetical protein